MLVALCALLWQAETVTAADPEWLRRERSEQHMGTQFTIALYATDEPAAERALQAAFQRIQQLDEALSNYRSSSELNQLCRGAPHTQPQTVSADLWRVLAASDQVSAQTDGAFDVTIGPLTKLWRHARRQQHWPHEEEWQLARRSVGFRGVELLPETRQVRLTRESMQLDLGGIAKGDALDEAMRVLEANAIRAALIDGGGDILASGAPPGRQGWQVTIGRVNPEDRNEPEETIVLVHQAVATSGDRWQFIEVNGRRYSHLIDARSGRPVEGQRSVSVLAPSGSQADAWASAVTVLGHADGLKRLSALAGCQGRVVEREGDRWHRYTTPAWPVADR